MAASIREQRMLGALLVVVALGLGTCGTTRHASTYALVPPPPPLQEGAVVVPPGEDHVWVAGAYRWEGGAYRWTEGRWARRPTPSARWEDGVWRYGRLGWYRVEGGWR